MLVVAFGKVSKNRVAIHQRREKRKEKKKKIGRKERR